MKSFALLAPLAFANARPQGQNFMAQSLPTGRFTSGFQTFTQAPGFFLKSYAPEILAVFFEQDASKVDKVLNHGCHCAKLDSTNPFMEHLGGHGSLDELDEICKNWINTRHCNDFLSGGTCFADPETLDDGTYTITIPFPIDRSFCSSVGNRCEADTCQIDLYYVMKIMNYFRDHPDVSVTPVYEAGTCKLGGYVPKERVCVGEAPELFMKTV